jgi:hypothetical protein
MQLMCFTPRDEYAVIILATWMVNGLIRPRLRAVNLR